VLLNLKAATNEGVFGLLTMFHLLRKVAFVNPPDIYQETNFKASLNVSFTQNAFVCDTDEN
jgi:hypothetical protein